MIVLLVSDFFSFSSSSLIVLLVSDFFGIRLDFAVVGFKSLLLSLALFLASSFLITSILLAVVTTFPTIALEVVEDIATSTFPAGTWKKHNIKPAAKIKCRAKIAAIMV